MNTDPIADLLTRIKNASRARKNEVVLPHSKVKEAILTNLLQKKFIDSFKVVNGEKPSHKNISIILNPIHSDIEVKRVSKPGQRIYVKAEEIKKVNGGLGMSIISTSKGIMTNEEAMKLKLGGEVLCEVY